MTGTWLTDRAVADLLAEHGLAGVPERRSRPTAGPARRSASSSAATSGSSSSGRRRPATGSSGATHDDEMREAWFAGTGASQSLAALRGRAGRVAYLGRPRDETGRPRSSCRTSRPSCIAWERPTHEPVARRSTLDRVAGRDRPAPCAAVERDPRVDGRAGRRWPAVVPAPRAAAPPARRAAERLRGRRATPSARSSWRAGTPSIGCAAGRAGPGRAARRPTRRRSSRALGRLPSVGLHGDLKLANVALLDGRAGRRSSTGR